MVSKYGIMDHFTLNLRPKEYFQLAPNMRTAYIELCIYLISNSVTYRPGRLHNGFPYGKYGMVWYGKYA